MDSIKKDQKDENSGGIEGDTGENNEDEHADN